MCTKGDCPLFRQVSQDRDACFVPSGDLERGVAADRHRQSIAKVEETGCDFSWRSRSSHRQLGGKCAGRNHTVRAGRGQWRARARGLPDGIEPVVREMPEQPPGVGGEQERWDGLRRRTHRWSSPKGPSSASGKEEGNHQDRTESLSSSFRWWVSEWSHKLWDAIFTEREPAGDLSVQFLHTGSTGNPQRNLIYAQKKMHCPQVVLLRFAGQRSYPPPIPSPQVSGLCRSHARKDLSKWGGTYAGRFRILASLDASLCLVRDHPSRRRRDVGTDERFAAYHPRHLSRLPGRVHPRGGR